MIRPGRNEAVTQARTGLVVPVYATVLADTETPVSVWLKLFAGKRDSFLLESVTGGDTVARYSFIGGEPFMVFRARGRSWSLSGSREESGEGDPITVLRELMAQYRTASVPGLPRFSGGAVGYVGYDAVRLWERIPDSNPDRDDMDEIRFGFYRDLLVFDNRDHRLLVVSNMMPGECESEEAAYREASARIGTILDRLSVRLTTGPVSVRQVGEVSSNVPREVYEQSVADAIEYIRAGDIFQVVLSQRFSVNVKAEPFDLYRVLRVVNPSPYMFYLACDGRSIIGASPEMLVRVEGRTVEVRPIAGTIRRGADEQEDAALEKALLADEKERAEHVMLVDLGRNDVGRVSEHGSVHVNNMMHIERYSHVMHIVSDVAGTMREGTDAFDALRACFPAGTLSGAPKVRAMEIIDELEQVRRGLYGGALGYIDFGGNMDTCIAIRTMVYRDGVASVQVGAGIVADSVPSREYDETVHKGRALFSAIAEAGSVVGGT